MAPGGFRVNVNGKILPGPSVSRSAWALFIAAPNGGVDNRRTAWRCQSREIDPNGRRQQYPAISFCGLEIA